MNAHHTKISPKKLLLTKWTAVTPHARQKHFLVSRVIQPDLPDAPIELVELEAVFSKAVQVIPWRELQNPDIWRQGWVASGTSTLGSPTHEALADAFETHPDFAKAPADGKQWDATADDGR